MTNVRCRPAAPHLLPLCLLLAITLPVSVPTIAADPTDETWPCQQRKVLEISPGQVWSGPSLDDVGNGWQGDPAVAEVARKIAARRTEIPEALDLVKQFAADAGAERNSRLTALAAGMLSILNSERASIIAGIERYASRQQKLADKIERQTKELAALPADGTEAERSQRADLQEIIDWDARIFQEREHSLTYICDLPVQLERRAFALGREIQGHLTP